MRLILTFIVALLFTLATPVRAIGVMPAPAADTEETVAAAKAEHKAMLDALTPAERRAYKKDQRRELRSAFKDLRQAKKSGNAAEVDQVVLILLAIFIPPLAVFLYEGEINTKFWISLILTILGFLPGIIYALLVVTGNAKK